jgi:hypothetical protein
MRREPRAIQLRGADPSHRADEVRADIARTRAHLAASVRVLKSEIALRSDWREWVRRKPAA